MIGEGLVLPAGVPAALGEALLGRLERRQAGRIDHRQAGRRQGAGRGVGGGAQTLTEASVEAIARPVAAEVLAGPARSGFLDQLLVAAVERALVAGRGVRPGGGAAGLAGSRRRWRLAVPASTGGPDGNERGEQGRER